MISFNLEEELSDLIAFQCVLVALRGAGAGGSEELLWQPFVAALVEQYGFRRVWYGRLAEGAYRPSAVFPARVRELADLPALVEESSPILLEADLALPISVDEGVEGVLVVDADGEIPTSRKSQIESLSAEVVTALAERRFRARSEEALRRAKLQAESANRAKSLMLANMSHEIRTPLTGVVGFATLLSGTALTGEQRDYVDSIRSSADALLSLINDILDFSKIEAGKLGLESTPLDIRKLVEKTVGLLAARAIEKGLRLWFRVDPSAPRLIAGDPMRLRQVLLNLLSNAVKFTSQGEVSLIVEGLPGADGHSLLAFVVRDTGPGIAPEHHQRIFDSFSQVDPSITRKFGGTGLGLTISKSLAEQMGGALEVESELGGGATFRFTIPVQMVEESLQTAARLPVERATQPADAPALRLIVADDNPVNRQVALALLRCLGYQADSAVNGVELLACLERSAYDAIFMDVQMPEMDGLEATRRIRGNWPRERQPRIIAMTAAAFAEDRAQCLEAGMDDYVSKPMDLADLAAALGRVPHPANGTHP